MTKFNIALTIVLLAAVGSVFAQPQKHDANSGFAQPQKYDGGGRRLYARSFANRYGAPEYQAFQALSTVFVKVLPSGIQALVVRKGMVTNCELLVRGCTKYTECLESVKCAAEEMASDVRAGRTAASKQNQVSVCEAYKKFQQAYELRSNAAVNYKNKQHSHMANLVGTVVVALSALLEAINKAIAEKDRVDALHAQRKATNEASLRLLHHWPSLNEANCHVSTRQNGQVWLVKTGTAAPAGFRGSTVRLRQLSD